MTGWRISPPNRPILSCLRLLRWLNLLNPTKPSFWRRYLNLMGSGHYDSSVTYCAITRADTTGASLMRHAADVTSGRVEAAVHPSLDPKRLNREGLNIRESRDNADHPTSRPVVVIFDTTSSMRHVPEACVRQLPDLMDKLKQHAFLPDPQILFGAINDATTYPVAALEIGQFESGNQMDGVITNILSSQGGGGGSSQESYELAAYYLARHTELDSLEKRKEKGYLFIIGDEKPYSFVSKEEVKQWIGDTIQANIPTADIFDELKEKFIVFWIFPRQAQNGNSTAIHNHIKELVGQNFILLPDTKNLCDTIVTAIAIHEGWEADAVAKALAADTKAATHAAEVDALAAAADTRPLDDL